jgi:hypothetical protein
LSINAIRLGVAFTLLTAACSDETSRRSVFTPEESARSLAEWNGREQLEGPYWRPTSAIVSAAEKRLVGALRRPREQPALPIWKYWRQHLGAHSEGRTVLFISGFCVDPDEIGWRWRTELVSVMRGHGGVCFFSALYDAELDEITQLHFSGDG